MVVVKREELMTAMESWRQALDPNDEYIHRLLAGGHLTYSRRQFFQQNLAQGEQLLYGSSMPINPEIFDPGFLDTFCYPPPFW